jgi:ribosome-interacting GTPase 1
VAVPANLPRQYYDAEEVYRQAKSPADKVEALETMLAIMPKHKGTDHLKAELRARIARLTQEAQRQAGGAARVQLYSVPKEGAGQVALLGLPNAGKSALMAALTDASPKVAEYPFTTQLPQPGMMPVDNVYIQLVDLPPVVAEETPPWQRALARQADLVLLVVDLSEDPLSEWETLVEELPRMRVEAYPPGEEALTTEGMEARPALVVATHADAPGAADVLELLELEVDGRLPVLAVSATTGEGLDALRLRVFEALDVVRVYAKPPGKPADRKKPFVLKRGSTVEELADAIHHELREKLKYALLWGASGKFGGQRVSRHHLLEDEDVVELYG